MKSLYVTMLCLITSSRSSVSKTASFVFKI